MSVRLVKSQSFFLPPCHLSQALLGYSMGCRRCDVDLLYRDDFCVHFSVLTCINGNGFLLGQALPKTLTDMIIALTTTHIMTTVDSKISKECFDQYFLYR